MTKAVKQSVGDFRCTWNDNEELFDEEGDIAIDAVSMRGTKSKSPIPQVDSSVLSYLRPKDR